MHHSLNQYNTRKTRITCGFCIVAVGQINIKTVLITKVQEANIIETNKVVKANIFPPTINAHCPWNKPEEFQANGCNLWFLGFDIHILYLLSLLYERHRSREVYFCILFSHCQELLPMPYSTVEDRLWHLRWLCGLWPVASSTPEMWKWKWADHS